MRIAIALLALALATTGCKKKAKPAEDMAGSGSATAGSGSDMGSGSAGSDSGSAGSDSGSAGSAADSGAGSSDQMANKAGMCPSTVFGATTKAEVKDKTVVVTVTATDKDAIAAIQKRT